MDRNTRATVPAFTVRLTVALRKESVDRNTGPRIVIQIYLVALRKESVDRNIFWLHVNNLPLGSLSARRAWIEITLKSSLKRAYFVALRKESVDRNSENTTLMVQMLIPVALRKESVDRNLGKRNTRYNRNRRSPQGERG